MQRIKEVEEVSQLSLLEARSDFRNTILQESTGVRFDLS